MLVLNPTPEECAYFAGLFAGEGCFCMYETDQGVPNIKLELDMTDEHAIKSIQQIWGGSVHKHNARARCRPIWRWCVCDRTQILAITQSIVPFMVGDKGQQAQHVIKLVELLRYYQARRKHERRVRHQPFELLMIYRVALRVREYALGRQKAWRPRWLARIRELEMAL